MKPRIRTFRLSYWSCYNPDHQHASEHSARSCIRDYRRRIEHDEQSDSVRTEIQALLFYCNRVGMQEIRQRFHFSEKTILRILRNLQFFIAIQSEDIFGSLEEFQTGKFGDFVDLYRGECWWLLGQKKITMPTWAQLVEENEARKACRKLAF